MFGKTKNHRRILFINPMFQGRLMAYGFVAAFVIICSFILANHMLFEQLRDIGSSLGLSGEKVFSQSLEMVFSWYTYMLVSFGLIVVAILLTTMLYITHRIAGPIYKLISHLDQIEKGEKPRPIKFRDGDFFPEVAESVNRAVLKLDASALQIDTANEKPIS